MDDELPGFTREFCTTRDDYADEDAEARLSAVDVGQASIITGHTDATLAEKKFVTKDRYYRILDGDVLRFTISRKEVEGT